MTDVNDIRRTLEKHSQQHLLRFYDELSPERRRSLLRQIATIDWDRIDGLVDSHVLNTPDMSVDPSRLSPPPIIPAHGGDDALGRELDEARRRGEKLIAEGGVAAFVVAGGQGTRLGYDGPKGCLEATPVTHKPLFQVFAEQILAAGRRHKTTVPWYVMTSPDNDVPTRAFFRQHNHFGLNARDVFFLTQGSMPAIGLDGKVLLAEKGRLALSPNGHGGSLLALKTSGALDDMARRGVEHISYFQVDNPLVRCLDPLFIGLHATRGAEMSAKALPKRDPMEKLGNFVLVDGAVRVIEYSDMPEELARRCNPGSIAIHVISRDFVERLNESGRLSLPFHRAVKKSPYIDEKGARVEPDRPNAVKLEMFVFDALALARETVILETLRGEEFSPIKNAEGPDSLATSLHDQVRRAAAWLEGAGITVPRDADGQIAAAIEISPLFAENEEELKKRVDRSLTISPGQSVYLGSRGQTGGLK